jgi:amidase
MGKEKTGQRNTRPDALNWEAYTGREVEQRTVGGGRRAELPDELWRWTGVEIARGVRTRLISSREAVESCLARIEQTNPRLNALVEVSAEEALDMAGAADRAVAAGETLGPLHGVPVSTKVNSDQEGHATTDGLVALKDNIAEVESPQVEKLREAGAVFVGRSNTPAFSYRWFADNDLHGRTLNPWDGGRTPGGSSGGAGSAVASGMVPIAHGNDIGGSIRYPAYACGVVGLRPSVACPILTVPRTPTSCRPCRAWPSMGRWRAAWRTYASLSMP